MLRRDRAFDDGVVAEVEDCPELREHPLVLDALAKLDAAQREVITAATIAARNDVATWLVESHLWRIFGAFERLLLLAGVDLDSRWRPESDEERAAYVASGKAWELRESAERRA